MSSPPQPPTVAIAPPHTAVQLVSPQPDITASVATVTAVALPRKFPAPCWSQEETLALINCYQDKWYSLRRRNLRTADWEAVAEEVSKRCPNQSPPKTSAQCRHKMEKLRKRYRTEKQRIMSLPSNGNNRFYGSSWVLYDLIDSMELGSVSGSNINANLNNHNHNVVVSNNLPISNVSKVDLEVKPFSMNNNNNNNMNMNMNMKVGNNINDGNDKKGDLGKYFDEMMLGMSNNNKGKSQNHEFDVRTAAPHIKFKVKNHHQGNNRVDYGGGDLNNDFDDADDYSGSGGGGGGGYYMQPSVGHKRKVANYDKYDEMFMPKMAPVNVNGNGCSSRKDYGDGSREREREKVSVVGEMVASIKMLGEGLVKMEKMKIEMMRDIEKMRMEMELKRSEMILESQHLIVNAFVEGLRKHKKVKATEIE